jgi:AcrR family transcriptional regulator
VSHGLQGRQDPEGLSNMPKAFTEREKQIISGRLKEKGSEMFVKYGVKRTTVDDLARSAGISKGSFFSFFPSKEELFVTIFEEKLEELSSSIKHQLDDKSIPAKEAFSGFLKRRFVVENNPLLSVFHHHEDFEYLMRKVTRERITRLILNDFNDLVSIIAECQKAGRIKEHDPVALAELFHTLFYISVRKTDMEAFYRHESNIVDALIGIIADHFFLGD